MINKKKVSPFEALKQANLAEPVKVEPSNIIAWEKWRCPFGTNMTEDEWPGAISPPHAEGEDIEFDSDNIVADDELPFHIGKNTELISTGLGIIPLTEYTNPGIIFNFWNGHTNFPITTKIKKLINSVDGVETLTIFTRYRIRIGVGKLFIDSNVMREINVTISQYLTSRKRGKLCRLQEEPSHKKVN